MEELAPETRSALAAYLASWLTPERRAKMERILQDRTRHITVVLEDLFQEHNASAVLRTCDALGIQEVHAVEKKNACRVNPEIALGSAQWLSLRQWKGDTGIQDACASLKARGYRIVATTPHTRASTLDQLDLETGKVALLFGTELTGLTEEALNGADEFVYVPMYGFVESFNISVTAAICLHHLTHKLRQSTIDWRLAPEDREATWLSWLRQSMKNAPALEKRFFSASTADGSP